MQGNLRFNINFQSYENLKLQQKANEINKYATKRRVEELFKNIKYDG